MRYSNSIQVRDIFTICNMASVIVCTGTFLPGANASLQKVERTILTDMIKCKIVPIHILCLYAYDAQNTIKSAGSYEALLSMTTQAIRTIQCSRAHRSPQNNPVPQSPQESGMLQSQQALRGLQSSLPRINQKPSSYPVPPSPSNPQKPFS